MGARNSKNVITIKFLIKNNANVYQYVKKRINVLKIKPGMQIFADACAKTSKKNVQKMLNGMLIVAIANVWIKLNA